ncbi:MAG: hypothetical protein QOF53_1510, partial [Nocardioidaceae bacterium]|nr:hypothetical protein [Nocardioidaceae bacterium]
GDLLDYYASRETLITVDGDRPVEEVTRSAISQLGAALRQRDAGRIELIS